MKHYEWQDKIDPDDLETIWVSQQRDPRN